MYHDQLNWLSTIYATFTVLESPHLIFAYGINKTPLTGWRLGDAADHAQRDARLVGRHLHGVKDEIEDHMRIIEREKKSQLHSGHPDLKTQLTWDGKQILGAVDVTEMAQQELTKWPAPRIQ